MQSCGQYCFRFDWTLTRLQLTPHIQKRALNYKLQLESATIVSVLKMLLAFPWCSVKITSAVQDKWWLLGNVCY